MSRKTSETLDKFFSISVTTLKKDLAEANGRVEFVAEEIKSLNAIDWTVRSPDIDARIGHLMMIQAHELCRNPEVCDEIKTLYASMGAERIAEKAREVSHDQDTLKALCEKMEAIGRREGLSEEEEWLVGEGPADYQKLEKEYEQISGRIRDTVFTTTLRRYHLDEFADLYEADLTAFEIQREVGRRLVFQDKIDENGIDSNMDSHFKKIYGEEALTRVYDRLAELCASEI